ncbi:flagellar basal body rod protein FlgB [Terrihabitans soli]|uniref:Flagellar basal body rod protein FlgB n=1 Tax=Terrihabitans soli TaxID=708113 RepID=A0A6S6QYE0_9HYPH|nr:flagellar basal body rod protein FlgB [Terrihabitans soli]BCJ91598.1 flagellar basal body rod protein FlgB [Terrihabitans soli]
MLFGDLPLVGMLKQKMAWHEQRQGVLAQNVANADTPGYKTRDLENLSFPELAAKTGGASGVTMVATDPRHMGPGAPGAAMRDERRKPYEVTPQGNAVVLEDEVMRVSQNVQDYQMAADLYSRGLGMLKMAVGRRS